MEKVTLFIIAASVLNAIAPRHYHFVYELKNWTEAQRYCREKFTDLAVLDDMDDAVMLNDLADLSKMVYSSDSYRAWIGLYDTKNTWMWSLSDSGFYKNGEAEFRNWHVSQPNSFGTSVYCVRIDVSGLWNDVNCDVLLKTICSDVEGQDVTFVYINTNMNWTDAQSYCRQHHTDLASIRNMSENKDITKLVPSGQVAWIGLYRDSWRWVDGRISSFKFWKTGEPNGLKENCAAAYFTSSGKWEDWDCGQKKAFICFSDSKHAVKLKLVRNSSLDLNDSAVQEELLKQLKQKLKDQRLEDNVKLSWKKQSDGSIFHKDKKETLDEF